MSAAPSRNPAAFASPDRSRVTVVVPTYNRREQLLRCVRGILACDTTGLEVHLRIVDDGSPDDTPEAVAGLQREYGGPVRLHYHRQENGGQSAARNTAIAASDTDLILFIDDDCQPETGWIQALVRAPWEDGLGAVGGKLVAASQDNVVSRFCRWIRYNEYPPSSAEGPGGSKLRFVNSANCAYRRQALQEIGGYELALTRGVDHDLGWRVILAGYGIRYEAAAEVRHYHREDLQVLLRDSWKRGYTNTLRRALWGTEPPATPARLRRETLRLALLRLHPPLLPADALRLRAQGIPARDALPFACYRWLMRLHSRRGKLEMLRRLAAGQQNLSRSARVPEGQVDPALVPRWAVAGVECD